MTEEVKLSPVDHKNRRNLLVTLTAILLYVIAGCEFGDDIRLTNLSLKVKHPDVILYFAWGIATYYVWQFRVAIGKSWSYLKRQLDTKLLEAAGFQEVFFVMARKFQADFPESRKSSACKQLLIKRFLVFYYLRHRTITGNGFKSQFAVVLHPLRSGFFVATCIDIRNILSAWLKDKLVSTYYLPFWYFIMTAIAFLFIGPQGFL